MHTTPTPARAGESGGNESLTMSEFYPETAARLVQSVPVILRRWVTRVRQEIPASRAQARLVLRNNLESLLMEVARTLNPNGHPPALVEGLSLSQDHGGHRATLAEYSLGEVFLEYRLLRQTILTVLDEKRSLSPDEREVINNALERAMQDAVSRFALVHQDAERQRADELRTVYERERRITAVLQRPLLVKVAEDAVPGLALAAIYEPAMDEAEVGGDFLDVFTLPNGRVALVVGDASGKGLEAAAHNTLVKEMLHAFLREDPGHPGVVLARLNNVVCDTLQSAGPSDLGTSIVVALLVIEPATGKAVYVAAGAEDLLIVRTSGKVETVKGRGLLLGVEPGSGYDERAVHLQPGDTTLMVTDGITEARIGVELFGYDGMVAVAEEALKAPSLQEAAHAILEGARAFAHGRLSDDACLILARRR
jgi:serine phosphatase RsbU (regulator of sigma subunit)